MDALLDTNIVKWFFHLENIYEKHNDKEVYNYDNSNDIDVDNWNNYDIVGYTPTIVAENKDNIKYPNTMEELDKYITEKNTCLKIKNLIQKNNNLRDYIKTSIEELEKRKLNKIENIGNINEWNKISTTANTTILHSSKKYEKFLLGMEIITELEVWNETYNPFQENEDLLMDYNIKTMLNDIF
ncbi:hypothetical protein BY458DRAFT_570359 [Sporodiniella umbellata]|nr:hypothetical protein BY458DRAFT_570359 [Sporodiniella umbellata]